MRKKLPKILITGGAGFIGSAFVRFLCGRLPPERLVIVDKLTYAGDLIRLAEAKKGYKFYRADICEKSRMAQIFAKEKPGAIFHFAAETHVDRSILDPDPFTRTNIFGTQALLELARASQVYKFIHISTDEVYGEIGQGKFNEDSPLRPNSPYAASKAAADLLVRSYVRTYGFPAVIVRPCNNYGPWQYPEKLIPLAILKLLKGEKIPIYAKGQNIREWLYVEDCVEAIYQLIESGKPGEIYNLGSGEEKRNIEVAQEILRNFELGCGRIQFVKDRLGHDLRYSLDSGRLRRLTGWKPKIKFNQGIRHTVYWSNSHQRWLMGKCLDVVRLYAAKTGGVRK